MARVHLSNADTFTVHLEQDPSLRSTIVALAVLDRPPNWDRLRRAVDRATRLEPNFRHRLQPGAGPLLPARWVEDPNFDLSWHLRQMAVTPHGGFEQVLEFARIAGMSAFDPVRPRWEFTVLEGLDDGRAVLVMKVHHALTDGIGGIQLAQHVVDLDRRGTRRAAAPEPRHTASGDLAERAADALTYDLSTVSSIIGGLVGSVPNAIRSWMRRPLSIWDELGADVESIARFVRPITTTLSPVMVERGLGWKYSVLDVPLARMRSSSAMAGGTINDAFLAGIAGGLSRYHHQHGSEVEELRVTMPISTRGPGDEPGGNKITLVRFSLPLGHMDPMYRMMSIDRATTNLRREPALDWSQPIAGVLNLLPTGVAAGMLKHVDLLASNVPGFDRRVFIAGARLEQFFAFGPTLGAAANITLMSYVDRCFIGVNVDTRAVPDDERFLQCLRDGFEELLALEVRKD